MRRRPGSTWWRGRGPSFLWRDKEGVVVTILALLPWICLLLKCAGSRRMATAELPELGSLQKVDESMHALMEEVSDLAERREKLYRQVEDGIDSSRHWDAMGYPHHAQKYADMAIHGEKGNESETYVRSPPDLSIGASKPLKIYVYNLPARFNAELLKRYPRCYSDQYGTEVHFNLSLKGSKIFRTRNAKEADFFFVPIYGECFLWEHEMLQGLNQETSFRLTNQFFHDALDIVITQHPWWNATQGRDHIFMFPGARGPTIFHDLRQTIPNSIFLTPEGGRNYQYFSTHKDVVIPGLEWDRVFWGENSRKEISPNAPGYTPQRKYLAYFRGTIDHKQGKSYSKGIRPRLRELFAGHDDIIYGTTVDGCNHKCYRNEMAQSTFCICPLGWTPWTLRFYQAVMVRCIPVVVADEVEFPYEDTIDYTKFALKIPQDDIGDIVQILRNKTQDEIDAMRVEMDKHWLKYAYPRPSVEGDAFHTVLQHLARKRRSFKSAPGSTWA